MRIATAAAAMALLAAAPALAQESAPFAVGSVKIVALSDGTNPLPMGTLLQGVDDATLRDKLEDPSAVPTSINAFLIDTGSQQLLVDAGNAPAAAGETKPTGLLAASLAQAGYAAADIDDVLITHMHGDHIGGLLTAAGTPTYPNARLHIAEDEAAYWMDMGNATDANRAAFALAAKVVEPYRAAGRLDRFGDGAEFAPGVVAKLRPGHTAGHTTYVVTSGERTAVLWGDTVHSAPVQFPDPSVTIRFDSDADSARAARTGLMAEAAEHQWLIGGAHLPFPGMGTLRKLPDGYGWTPLAR